jgi:hypothetical protein
MPTFTSICWLHFNINLIFVTITGNQSIVSHIFQAHVPSNNNNGVMEIRYRVEGEDATFRVKGNGTDHIELLKIHIQSHPHHGMLQNVDRKDLALYKVSTIFWSGNTALTNVLCLIRWMPTLMVAPGNLLHLYATRWKSRVLQK